MCHNYGLNADFMSEWMRHEFDVTIFDSGSTEEPPTAPALKLPNLFWSGCWHEAIRHYHDYDILWVVCADVELHLDAAAYRGALESAYPFGCWSPAIMGSSLDLMSYGKAKERLWTTRRLEGMCLAVGRELMTQMRGMPAGNKFGWGMDTYMCWRAKEAGLRNLLDGRVFAFHPQARGYSSDAAHLEMKQTMVKLIGPDWRQKASHHVDSFEELVIGEVIPET
jgi:hypothetical protein